MREWTISEAHIILHKYSSKITKIGASVRLPCVLSMLKIKEKILDLKELNKEFSNNENNYAIKK